MVSSVLEIIIVCGWGRPLQMLSSAYILLILNGLCRPYSTLVYFIVLKLKIVCGWDRALQLVSSAYIIFI